jgi:regulator of nucleoside diphosphate kinase
MNANRELPPIKVTTSDYNSLLFTAVLARRLGDQNAEFLISELTRASVCHPDDLPEHVVSTNCRVIYRLDEEPRTHACLLVHPKDLLFPGVELSVITPLGAALLGLQLGDRMPYKVLDAQSNHEVLVEGIGVRFVGEGMPSRNLRTELFGGHFERDAPH